MTFLEFRQCIESQIDWWVPFVLPIFVLPLVLLFDKLKAK